MRGFDFDKALVALQNELHCFAYKLTADKDEAEDLLQETMLRTLDNKDKFDSGTNFKGWMYTIMRNAFINNCRTKKIRGNLYVLSEPKYHFLLRDDSFIVHTVPGVILQLMNDFFLFLHGELLKFRHLLSCNLPDQMSRFIL